MKKSDSLAADYWIENTKQIYADNLHVSSPVMDAYRAGYDAGLQRAYDYWRDSVSPNVKGFLALFTEEAEGKDEKV